MSKADEMMLFDVLARVREQQPLVECITNFVTVNDCANILLAAGASPTMSHDVREVEESVTAVRALVCNLGAIDRIESMILAGKKANVLGIPVVFDPVGAGATTLRRESSTGLLREVKFTAIRGNASEVRALARSGIGVFGSGVDVSQMDVITEENLPQSMEMVSQLSRETGAVIAVSGVIDVISDGTRTMVLRNGCPMMSRITGSGCMLTTLIGAFCGVEENAFAAVCSAMAVMGVCGELADERRMKNGTGNATFRIDLIDAVFNLKEEEFKEKVHYEIYKE